MLHCGKAMKVTVHLNEDTNSQDNFLYQQVFQLLYDNDIAGATLSRLQQGFGTHHRLHDAQAYGARSQHLPVRIEFIDTPEKVQAILPRLCAMVSDGLVEMHETTILKAATQEDSL